MNNSKLSPMMAQYLATKKKYPDCLLFYRVGDFYEMFYDDAMTGSEELDLVLTGKDCGLDERAPMCGVPFHAADSYISRLVKKGFKVAVCDQVEDPKEAKGIVRRAVTRIVTPGTLTENEILDEHKNNYLLCIYHGEGSGIAAVDISTGEFQVTEVRSLREVYDEISRFMPSELIYNSGFGNSGNEINALKENSGISMSQAPDNSFDKDVAVSILEEHFHAKIEGLGLSDMPCGIRAAGAVLRYVYDTQFSRAEYIISIKPYINSEYMILDTATVKNLELLESMRDRDRKGTLLWVMDKTRTAMGSRLMRRIVSQPLLKKEDIEARQDAVAELNDRFIDRAELTEYLGSVYDLERLLAKISSGRAVPPDLIKFRNSLAILTHIKNLTGKFESQLLRSIADHTDTLSDLHELLLKAIDDEAPVSIKDGGIIKDGYSEEADRLKSLKSDGRQNLLALEAKERELTGIKSLRIKFNKNFGHCIEVTNTFKDKVPDRYIRKQTLTTGERYTTEELERMSSDINGADERLNALEYELYMEVLGTISAEAVRIQTTASALALLDVLCSFSNVAARNKYVRPSINEKGVINIKDGRHPVVELMTGDGGFIPNDTYLNTGSDRIAVITGPNMAGKSTYMRQTALIALMAQTGSFVPAKSADICISDRIFTRVGASDDLASGRSTFMVEMTEVANILRRATKQSLLILDEIGRGTSTYDGLSIAWSVIEYISDKKKLGAKTLFATHYHELTELEGKIAGVHNYCISVSEHDGDLVFLRKIIHGGADKSYGIQVARLAGVPMEVINRAHDIADMLSGSDIAADNDKIRRLAEGSYSLNASGSGGMIGVAEDGRDNYDFSMPEASKDTALRAIYKETAERIMNLDINKLTPMEALFLLSELKEKLGSS